MDWKTGATALSVLVCLGTGCAVRAQNAPAPGGLRAPVDKRRLLFGTAVNPDLLNPQTDAGRYEAAVRADFNMVEPENSLKPPVIWQDRTAYDFRAPDVLLGAPGQKGWAQRNGMIVRGHTLIYGRDDGWTLPGWLVTGPGRSVNKPVEDAMTKTEAADLLHKYISAVAGRYKGKVAVWDVINETIDDRKNDRPYNLRDSFWFRKLGPDYVALAFRWAHEADPAAKLYYNDYGIEGPGAKADAVFAMAQSLKAQGVPIDGIGMQWHIGVNTQITPGDGFYRTAQRLKDNGINFMVTELDVSVPVAVYPPQDPRYGLVPLHPADLDAQGRVYGAVLRYALSFPNCRGFQMWGFTDRHSWIPDFTIGRLKETPPGRPQGAATILDADYRPKPAYAALQEELAQSPPKGR